MKAQLGIEVHDRIVRGLTGPARPFFSLLFRADQKLLQGPDFCASHSFTQSESAEPAHLFDLVWYFSAETQSAESK